MSTAIGSAEPGRQQAAETLSALSSLRAVRPVGLRVLPFVVTHRAALLRMLRYVRSLPIQDVVVTDSPQGRELAAHLGHRQLGVRLNRWMVSVLHIPADPHLYLRGRHRQAVRTNLRRAEKLGVTWREVCDADEASGIVAAVLGTRESEWAWVPETARTVTSQIDRGVVRIFVAEDTDARPMAVAAVIVDREWARMSMCVSAAGDHAFAYRYALNVAIVEQLSTEGVRYLFVDSALRLSPGLQYFQRRLGYVPVNLRMIAS